MKFTIRLFVIWFEVEGFANEFPSQVKLNGDIIFTYGERQQNQFLVCKICVGHVTKLMMLRINSWRSIVVQLSIWYHFKSEYI